MRIFHPALCGVASAGLFIVFLAGPARSQEPAPAERTITVRGIERSYVVHVPRNTSRPAPVVMVFHGGGGRPNAIARKTGVDDLADRNGFIAVYPAGLPGPSGRGGTWNVGGSQSRSTTEDVAFVQAILRNLERTAPIDHARIYATGLSMGGVFSYRLACQMSDVFAAIAPVAASMAEPSCQPGSPVAVLHIHGTDDDHIPIDVGRGPMTAGGRVWPPPRDGISAWRRFDGCAGEPTQRDDGFASCTIYGKCRASVEYCVIKGGRHLWPEGASQRVWSFFAAHPKPSR